MSYTSVTLTGQVMVSPGVGLPGAVVTVTLSSEISDGQSVIEPLAVSANCDAEGNLPAYEASGALVVQANDDLTTSPQGTYYTVTITSASGVYDSWRISVPHASAPSVDLFSLPRIQIEECA